jgi:hypothetical protein
LWRRRLSRLSASHAAKPRNHIHAVFRIMPMLQREVAARLNRRGSLALFYTK